MFKAIQIGVLLLILFFVSVSTWLTQARSTDWNKSLWVKVYPINGDGSELVDAYIRGLKIDSFTSIEGFIARETGKFGHTIARPVRMELGEEIHEQPPAMAESPSTLRVVVEPQKALVDIRCDRSTGYPAPDVRIFVRYHTPTDIVVLENSVGLQKGMVGIVNAYASRQHASANNVIIAHELLHTLGATDKYEPSTGLPAFPLGYAEPDRKPKYPQRYAEIMGGRIPLAEGDAVIPKSLRYVTIGDLTAREIRLTQ